MFELRLCYTQYTFVHGCLFRLNRIPTVQVSDTTMHNSSNTASLKKNQCIKNMLLKTISLI